MAAAIAIAAITVPAKELSTLSELTEDPSYLSLA